MSCKIKSLSIDLSCISLTVSYLLQAKIYLNKSIHEKSALQCSRKWQAADGLNPKRGIGNAAHKSKLKFIEKNRC